LDITVSSRHVEVSAALRDAAIEKVGRLERYLEDMDRAEVHFSAEHNPRIEEREICEVTITGPGHVVRAKVTAADQFAAIDAAVAKLEHQLHKLKTRLVARQQGKLHTSAKATPRGGVDGDEPGGEPRLVKSKRFAVKPMTVDEAILQMELLGHAFFFFENAASGDAAVVYWRTDGDIGLIERER
jgi:ribosome hibernation promoting factor